jgi:origin recognition complex subunit 5
VIIVISTHQQRFLGSESPHIHFPPYTKEESIEILSKYVQPIPRVSDESSDEEPEYTGKDAKDDLWVWQKFCGTVWDSLAKGSARNIVQFRTAVEKMWIPFVQPIAKGEYATRNYSSLYLRNKEMFRQETSVIDNVLPPVAAERATTSKSMSRLMTNYVIRTNAFHSHARPTLLLKVSFMRRIPCFIQPSKDRFWTFHEIE